MKRIYMDKFEASIAIQGFGNVGENAARILHERGYKVIAVSDGYRTSIILITLSFAFL